MLSIHTSPDMLYTLCPTVVACVYCHTRSLHLVRNHM